jgi:hypothetical protein
MIIKQGRSYCIALGSVDPDGIGPNPRGYSPTKQNDPTENRIWAQPVDSIPVYKSTINFQKNFHTIQCLNQARSNPRSPWMPESINPQTKGSLGCRTARSLQPPLCMCSTKSVVVLQSAGVCSVDRWPSSPLTTPLQFLLYDSICKCLQNLALHLTDLKEI